MLRQELIKALKKCGVTFRATADRRLSISSSLIRVEDFSGLPTAFVAPGKDDDDDQVRHGVVDAVHWALHGLSQKVDRVRVVVAKKTKPQVLDALNTMAGSFSSLTVVLEQWEVDAGNIRLRPFLSPLPRFNDERVSGWAEALKLRSTKLPPFAKKISQGLGAPPWFAWYQNVTGTYLSGRVGGWEVCTLKNEMIRFGETGRERAAGPGHGLQSVAMQVANIRAFAKLRRDGKSRQGRRKAEHLVESGIWAGTVVLKPRHCAKPLLPLSGLPLQMPALFSPSGNARFIDAVLHDGAIPWCVELKVATGGQGQYYRHALTQAVLYRAFLRRAKPVHSWFKNLSPALDAARCEAAIAFPTMTGRGASDRTDRLRSTARSCGVELIEIAGDIDQLRAQIL
jgi:hypothetical protein